MPQLKELHDITTLGVGATVLLVKPSEKAGTFRRGKLLLFNKDYAVIRSWLDIGANHRNATLFIRTDSGAFETQGADYETALVPTEIVIAEWERRDSLTRAQNRCDRLLYQHERGRLRSDLGQADLTVLDAFLDRLEAYLSDKAEKGGDSAGQN